MRTQQVFRVVTVCACLFAVCTPVVFGALQPEYSHVRDFISLLGAKDAPYATWVNWYGFLPLGLLVAVACFFLPTILPRSRLLWVGSLFLLSVSVGYLGAVLAPCDRGCPPTGSLSQEIHNVLGLIEYAGAAIGLGLCAGALLRRPQWQAVGWLTVLSAVVVAVCLTFLLTPALQPWRGLWQRVAEGAIFAWFFLIAVVA
jgi:hypothetical protein